VVPAAEDRTTAERTALGHSIETGVELPENFEDVKHLKNPNRYFETAARFGLIAALIMIIVVFGLLKPAQFLTIANLKTTVALAAPLLVLAIGLTVPLSMGEFDLSIANSAQLSGAVICSLISVVGLNWGLAIAVDAAGAIIVGGLIGFVIVRSSVNAFIVTLGAGTFMAGIEFGIAHGATIFTGIPPAYIKIGTGNFLGIPIPTIVALVFAGIIWVVMERTVAGRRMRAIGGNSEAARLSGVRVDQLRAVGFIVSALAGVVTAVLFTAASSSYYPNALTAELLPAYAACFLGTTVFRANLFEVTGTLVGVAFLATIQDGLIMTGVSSWLAQVVQGTLLVVAVVGSKAASRRLG
jgi:ribose transport system permease protein